MCRSAKTPRSAQHIISQKIGRNIYNLRKSRGIKREELASYLRVSVISVYKYEIGETNISVDKLVYLMQFLDCSLEDLFFGLIPPLQQF